MNGPKPIEFDRVADLYDFYVRTDFDIPFWLKRSQAVHGKVLELACGTGRVSIPLLLRGVKLSCVDYAPDMLARFGKKLREHNLSCPTYCQDITELNLPDRYDLIFIPFHSFSEITDRQKHRLALQRIRLHLSEQGTFICTLQNPVVRTTSMNGDSRLIGEFPTSEGQMLRVSARMTFHESTQIASGEQVYERISAEGSLLERRLLDINFYLFQRDEFELLLSEHGFVIETLYGDYECNPFEVSTSPYMIWVARPA